MKELFTGLFSLFHSLYCFATCMKYIHTYCLLKVKCTIFNVALGHQHFRPDQMLASFTQLSWKKKNKMPSEHNYSQNSAQTVKLSSAD